MLQVNTQYLLDGVITLSGIGYAPREQVRGRGGQLITSVRLSSGGLLTINALA